jgi:hypothetical protein
LNTLSPAFRTETLAAIDAVRAGLTLVRARHAAEDVRTKGPGILSRALTSRFKLG